MSWPADETRERHTDPGRTNGGSVPANPPNLSATAGNTAGSKDAAPGPVQTPRSPEPDKQKPALDLLPSVSLPKGGAAIRGMGEKFSVTAANGTVAMSGAAAVQPGATGFDPGFGIVV
jgi:hypothetical protein